MRILASIGTLLVVALACATPAQAQEFPSKPVKLIVPYAAGGGTDIVARIVAQKLQDKWGPAVIVEHRAGARWLHASVHRAGAAGGEPVSVRKVGL